jgi:hypothetical protein
MAEREDWPAAPTRGTKAVSEEKHSPGETEVLPRWKVLPVLQAQQASQGTSATAAQPVLADILMKAIARDRNNPGASAS